MAEFMELFSFCFHFVFPTHVCLCVVEEGEEKREEEKLALRNWGKWMVAAWDSLRSLRQEHETLMFCLAICTQSLMPLPEILKPANGGKG